MINGFSKFSKKEKINWLFENYFHEDFGTKDIIEKYLNSDDEIQKIHDEFSENTISNFYLPLGVAPNFLINQKDFVIPMAIEESSVVAAASKSAKFWHSRGGFKTKVIKFKKTGLDHTIGNPPITRKPMLPQEICQIWLQSENIGDS